MMKSELKSLLQLMTYGCGPHAERELGRGERDEQLLPEALRKVFLINAARRAAIFFIRGFEKFHV